MSNAADDTPSATTRSSMPSLDTLLFDCGLAEEDGELEPSPQVLLHSPVYEPHSPLGSPPPPSPPPSPPTMPHRSTKELLLKDCVKNAARSSSPVASKKRSPSPMEHHHREAKRMLKQKPIRSSPERVPSAKRWKKHQRTQDGTPRRQRYESTERYADDETPRRPPAPPRHQREPRNNSRQRQVFYHSGGFVVLAANRMGGYTLTNGTLSICEDQNEDWLEHLLGDLQSCFKFSRLYVVDEVSRRQWNKAKGHLEDNHCMKKLEARLLDDISNTLGLCSFCRKPLCHRWKAIVGGVQQLLDLPMDPIRH